MLGIVFIVAISIVALSAYLGFRIAVIYSQSRLSITEKKEVIVINNAKPNSIRIIEDLISEVAVISCPEDKKRFLNTSLKRLDFINPEDILENFYLDAYHNFSGLSEMLANPSIKNLMAVERMLRFMQERARSSSPAPRPRNVIDLSNRRSVLGGGENRIKDQPR